MFRRSRASRLALWVAMCALVLRAGMPMLATLAAQLRGVPVSEVCEVYGVALPAMSAQTGAEHKHHHHADHRNGGHHSDAEHRECDHCALTSLGALATPCEVQQDATDQAGITRTVAETETLCDVHDACAAWVARLEHGPPPSA